MSDMMLQIGAQTIGCHLKDFEGSVEDRLKLAFRRAWTDDTWFTGDENVKYQSAMAAVLMSLDELSEDRLAVERSLKATRALNAMLSGGPVDVAALDTEGLLPLTSWWIDVKAEVER